MTSKIDAIQTARKKAAKRKPAFAPLMTLPKPLLSDSRSSLARASNSIFALRVNKLSKMEAIIPIIGIV